MIKIDYQREEFVSFFKLFFCKMLEKVFV